MNVDIESIKRKLLIKYPLFGMIVANTDFEINLHIDTADTNGKIVRYNPAFINSLTQEEQIFAFAHEISHIAFDHIPKSKDKDIKIWNIATDAVINANLARDGLPMPKGSVDIPEAINYNAEEMYEKLLEQEKNKQNGSHGQSSNNNSDFKEGENSQNQEKGESSSSNSRQSGSQNNQSNKDSSKEKQSNGPTNHSIWKEALEEIEKAEQKQAEAKNGPEQDNQNVNKKTEKSSLFDKLFNRNKQKESADKKETEQSDTKNQEQKEENKKRQEQIKKLSDSGEKQIFKQNQIDRKSQLEELRKALAEKSHGTGTGSNQEVIQISDIGKSIPLIDWRKLLKEAVKYDIDWSYQNASIEDGVVTPYLEEFPQPETEIVLDTSGSINETLLRNFLRECKNILQNSKVKVGCFDDEFYGFTEIRTENDIDNMQFIGRGGTNFNAAVNAFSRRVENKIIFTDGRATMPNKPIDAIWIVFGGNQINPKGGRVIYIDNEQLRKLCLYENNSSYRNKSR